MDLIVLSVGLTILIARDIYRTVKRKRKEKKLKKRLREAGMEYDARMGRPIAAPRTSRNHPDRPNSPPYHLRGRTRGPRQSERGFTADWDYRRSRTIDGSEFYASHVEEEGEEEAGLFESEYCYGRVPTPPPAYSPPLRPSSSQVPAASTELPPPPPFEHHAHTSGAGGQSAEAQRKLEGIEALMYYDGRRVPGQGVSQ